jgi:hydrogenase maturation protease
MTEQRSIILGLGNPILGDDGIGWVVAESLQEEIHDPRIMISCLGRGGLYLMERLVGYERAILIDATVALDCEPGTVVCVPLEELDIHPVRYTLSVHDTSLPTAVEMGRQLGLDLPRSITAVLISTLDIDTFTTEISPPVMAAIPKVKQAIGELLKTKEPLPFG